MAESNRQRLGIFEVKTVLERGDLRMARRLLDEYSYVRNGEYGNDLYKALKRNDLRTAGWIVDNNLNLSNSSFDGALRVALKEENFRVADFIMERGLDVSSSRWGITLRELLKEGNFRGADFIMEHGLDVSEFDPRGIDAVDWIAEHGLDQNYQYVDNLNQLKQNLEKRYFNRAQKIIKDHPELLKADLSEIFMYNLDLNHLQVPEFIVEQGFIIPEYRLRQIAQTNLGDLGRNGNVRVIDFILSQGFTIPEDMYIRAFKNALKNYDVEITDFILFKEVNVPDNLRYDFDLLKKSLEGGFLYLSKWILDHEPELRDENFSSVMEEVLKSGDLEMAQLMLNYNLDVSEVNIEYLLDYSSRVFGLTKVRNFIKTHFL